MNSFLHLVLNGLLSLLLGAGVFVVFLGGVLLAYGITLRARIVDDDAFFPLGLVLGMILGAVIAQLITRSISNSKVQDWLRVYIVMIMLSLTPITLALINTKLDFRASRIREAAIIHQSGDTNEKTLPVRAFDSENTFFWLSVKPEHRQAFINNRYVRLTTKPGLLGFEWIQEVHEPGPRPFPSDAPIRSIPDPSTTPVEK